MLTLKKFFYHLLSFPLKLRVNPNIVPSNFISQNKIDLSQPIFYVLRHHSASDILTLRMACEDLNLPDPLSEVSIQGKNFPRTIGLNKSYSLFLSNKTSQTSAIAQGLELLKHHNGNSTLNAQIIPVNIICGRKPQKNKWQLSESAYHSQTPNIIKKAFIVLFRGGHTLARFSQTISFKEMVQKYGSDPQAARKFIRIASLHFYKQNIAAKGPSSLARKDIFKLLLATPSIQSQIKKDAQSKNISEAELNKKALAMMDEIAGDYNDAMVRFGERILGWLWKRLYSHIEINHAQGLQDVAQAGHEILYIPCHRSHMDYLLLTYVIFHQGLVTPRIAAGINLNFWPAGPIFRKSGAFFIRRSFKGDRLYSTIFREYLSLLFERGYPVKYYAEGGRSRTGKLLTPKTGMLSMTLQSMLKGIDRPLTIVPVYIGYEHVMEVDTYHQELSGHKKKGESIFGVIRAIKNLRDYGRGYVNFGKPINVNQFLNQHEPTWKNDITSLNQQKPQWLIEQSNVLANKVMVAINSSVALNGVSLIALSLLAARNSALSKNVLIAQLNFLIKLQELAPFNSHITYPNLSGEALLQEVISLNKVSINEDSFGSAVSLSPDANLEMRYYRNNILHSYLLPALLCRIIERNSKIKEEDLIALTHKIMNVIKGEFFIYEENSDIKNHTHSILNALLSENIVLKSKAGFYSLTSSNTLKFKATLLGECIHETLQRIFVVLTLLKNKEPLNKTKIEKKAKIIAQRLSIINNIESPEINDKKAQAQLLDSLVKQNYVAKNEHNEYIETEELAQLYESLKGLMSNHVLQSLETL